jgi:hypothetical protein
VLRYQDGGIVGVLHRLEKRVPLLAVPDLQLLLDCCDAAPVGSTNISVMCVVRVFLQGACLPGQYHHQAILEGSSVREQQV